MKKAFEYIEPLWQNRQHELSLRAVLAIAFSVDFIRNLSHAVFKWDTGHSYEGLSLLLATEAGLIVSLLGLTAIQNIQDKKTETDLDKTKVNVNKTTDDPDISVSTLIKNK